MISESIRKACFADATVVVVDGNAIAVKTLGTRKALFSGATCYEVAVLYYLTTREINFGKAADAVVASVAMNGGGKPIAIEAKWIVTGNGVGIYLFDAVNTKENSGYRGMVNSLCTIDQESGKTFFKPGTSRNEAFSKRLECLYSAYEPDKAAVFEKEFRQLFDILMTMLDDGKFLKRARTIRKPPVS